jgi:hypothetical protein
MDDIKKIIAKAAYLPFIRTRCVDRRARREAGSLDDEVMTMD